MSMQTDVRAAHLNAGGVAVPFRTRVKGFICTGTSTNTEIVVYDNATDASGDILVRFDSGTAATGTSVTFSILIPGEGIIAKNGVYVDLGAGGVTLTVFYG